MPSDSGETHRWLSDILYHIDLAQSFTAGMTREDFIASILHFYAVTRCLEIISESSRRLPDLMKERHLSIQWQKMAAAGNVYRHDYEDVEASYVWVTVQDHLPPLRAVVELELAGLDSK